jgi:hypothetical protein
MEVEVEVEVKETLFACMKVEGLKNCRTGSGSPGVATVTKYGWNG